MELEELEHVAANAAAEAVKEAFLGIDVERRRLLGVKRTEALPRRPHLLERYVLLNHLQDVYLQAQIVDEWLREESH